MKIALLFPGYSSQFVGMAKELYDESRLMQEYFEEASHCLDKNFVKLCFASSETELGKLENAYESIFLVSTSIAAVLFEKGLHVDMVTGYGVGEYSAICSVGGLTLPDGLYFLSKYAQFYQEVLESLSVRSIMIEGIPVETITSMCADLSKDDKAIAVGVQLSKNACVVSGDVPLITQMEDYAIEQKATVKNMPIESGLHSSLMDPVAEQLNVYLQKVDFNDLQVPLLASIDGSMVTEGDTVRSCIMKKINTTVRWDRVMDELSAYDLIIEVGPGSKLSKMITDWYPKKTVISINKPADIEALQKIVAPVEPAEPAEPVEPVENEQNKTD